MKKKSVFSAVALSVFIAQSFAQSVSKGDPSFDWEGIYGEEPYFVDGVAWVFIKGGGSVSVVVDTHGKEISSKYESRGGEPSDGMISFWRDNKSGYMDMTGKEVIAPQFGSSEQFHNGLAPVQKGDKWGVIRKDGSYLIEPKYSSIGSSYWGNEGCSFEYGTATIYNRGDGIGIVDTKGNFIVPMIYQDVRPMFGTGYALQDENNRWSVFNHKGVKIIDYRDKVDDIPYPGYYRKDGSDSDERYKYGLLGQDGKILTPAIYDRFSWDDGIGEGSLSGGLMWAFDTVLSVEKNGKFGFIDKLGKEVIPVIYENHQGYYFSEYTPFVNKHAVKLIPVKLNGKWGYVNLRGQTVIPFKYTEAGAFDNDTIEEERMTPVAPVTLADGTEGYIDAKGKFNVDADALRTLIQE